MVIIRAFSKHWKAGLALSVVQMLFLFTFEAHNGSSENVFDYLNGFAYHLVNSVIGFLHNGNGWPSQYYEWRYHRWDWWAILLALAALQWFVIGSAIAQGIGLKRDPRPRMCWWKVRMIQYVLMIFAIYALWYTYLFAYSCGWSLTHPASKYFDCGVLGPLSRSAEQEIIPFNQLENAVNTRNEIRKKFADHFNANEPARMSIVHAAEEYPAFTEHLYLEGNGNLLQVYDFRDTYRFRDLSWRGWSQRHRISIRAMQIVNCEAEVKMADRSSLPWVDKHPDLQNLCLAVETSDGRKLLY